MPVRSESAPAEGDAPPSFRVEYRPHEGAPRADTDELLNLSTYPFEKAGMVRRPPAYQGQRNFPGYYYAATTRKHVQFESWLERSHLTLLDFDADVVAFVTQPLRLLWRDADGAQRRHVPDVFVRYADGRCGLVDIRPAARMAADRELFNATEQAAYGVDWEYKLKAEPTPLVMRNVEWLAGYRRHVPMFDEFTEAVLDAAREPIGIRDLTSAAGGSPEARATVFHLLWRQLLHADLSASVLSPCSEVWVA